MSCEKSSVILDEKTPFHNEYPKKKVCSKSVVSWVLAAFLVALIVVLTVQFLYPAVEKRIQSEIKNFNVYEDNPIEVNLMSQSYPSSKEASLEKKGTKKTDEEDKHMPWRRNFLINPVDLCITRNHPKSEEYLKGPEVKLLMLVSSATGHFAQRQAIRNTWGSIANSLFGPMRLGFVLGTTSNTTEEQLILQESQRYKDIIQADFEDTYRNLTTKSIVMLKWVAKYCPHSQFFLKADDDTFINVGIIARILGKEPFASKDKFIGGYVHSGAQPSRDPDEKYYVSEDDYSKEEYPPYASGHAYITLGSTAAELFDAAQLVQPLLPMEDVFITGLCAQEIQAELIHDPRFRYEDPPRPPTWSAYSNLASAHSITPDELEIIWEDMAKTLLDHLYQIDKMLNETTAQRK
ncbi:hypothetical protein X975_21165, partial [Stegodyphus mimosarum]